MKIAVLGAGAIGSMFGGLIKYHQPELDVLLIARGEHGRRMQQSGGVVLQGPWGTRRVGVAVSLNPRDVAGADWVVLTVKSQDTETALAVVGDRLNGSRVVSIQNGLNQHVLRRYVRPDRLVLGVTATNMAILEPGTVSYQYDGITALGAATDETPPDTVDEAVEVLGRSGLKVHACRDIFGLQYSKLAINAVGYASVLSASRLVADCLLYRRWRQIVAIPILDECLAVMAQAGIRPTGTPGFRDAFSFRRLLSFVDHPLIRPAAALVARAICRRTPIIYSLQQDLMRGKTTEIDHLNGRFVQIAQQCGAQAAYNAKVVELTHLLEGRRDRSFYTREEVIAAFAAIDPDSQRGEVRAAPLFPLIDMVNASETIVMPAQRS